MEYKKIIQSTGFKIAVILICIAVTALTLHQYAKLIQHLLTIKYDWQFELFMVTGMLFFQYPFIYKKTRRLKMDYYFNMVLVSAMGALLLFPLLILNHYSDYTDTFNIGYFFTVVLIMFFIHKKIVAKLNLPVLISYTWVLYRIIILIFILT
ncbi:MAG: hypothetical protein ABIO79_13195 [Ferruginibacter sp.]